ncbi:hypothetical protein Pla110_19500 [Polystyrenella longa]|uniref:Deoxyhypusine synthase n=1 Tax=Polystyrenella longa TaxID=2528007 RepID=A0A518CLW1_9PLAN|nr:hypothetical protein [Polystyrenella longa]QDU80226.1 hypothetical protein Pla110_19500 [Polystyrenella longa]
MSVQPLDLSQLKVLPLAQRESLTQAESILIDPDSEPKPVEDAIQSRIQECADNIRSAREKGATVMLVYGAHLLRNGTAGILERMMANDHLTHLATNGAGTIHDWEYSWFGASTESVKMNVNQGTFGTWDETSTNIHRAIMAGAFDGLGYGVSLGKLIMEDGVTLPTTDKLLEEIKSNPTHPLTGARFDLLKAMTEQGWNAGRTEVNHKWKHASIIAQAYKHKIPMTVHPGIGYDIISNHSVFSGSAIGRAAEWDFKLFGGSVEGLDEGVVLSVGSAIMGPQVFEKTISCVNNMRLQAGRNIVQDHSFYVVDIADGGGWDWTQGEPPKTNPAYYLRFCKSYSRMGGVMHYLQADNATFIHHLYKALS